MRRHPVTVSPLRPGTNCILTKGEPICVDCIGILAKGVFCTYCLLIVPHASYDKSGSFYVRRFIINLLFCRRESVWLFQRQPVRITERWTCQGKFDAHGRPGPNQRYWRFLNNPRTEHGKGLIVFVIWPRCERKFNSTLHLINFYKT